MDWTQLRDETADALVVAVRRAVAEHPDERLCAAGLFGIYREQRAGISPPELAVNSDQALAERVDRGLEEYRWHPADWDQWVAWWSEDRLEYWAKAVSDEAVAGSAERWEATFRRYLGTLAQAAKQARKTLRNNGDVDKDFVVLVHDDEYHEWLIKRCLTPAEVRRWFPQFDAHAVELARLAALPEAERIAYYVPRLTETSGLITRDEAEPALRAIGPAAIPQLLARLDDSEPWGAISMLIDLGRADDEVIAALQAELTRSEGSTQLWAARALSQLGRLDLVLAQEGRIPDRAVVQAVTAPLSSSRDHQAAPRPLDYRPVEELMARRPDLIAEVAVDLRPGSVACEITAAESGEALRMLGSPHALLRQHAVMVLGEPLGKAAAERVLPALARLVESDPEPTVRRLAVLGLGWWGKPALGYAEVFRAALADPDPTVRAAAVSWLEDNKLPV